MFDTDYLYTNARPSNSPSTSTLCRSKEAIKLRRPKNLSQKFITVRRLWHARQPRFSPLPSTLSLSLSVLLHTVLCVSAISRGTAVKYEQKNIVAKMKNLSTVGRKHSLRNSRKEERNDSRVISTPSINRGRGLIADNYWADFQSRRQWA